MFLFVYKEIDIRIDEWNIPLVSLGPKIDFGSYTVYNRIILVAIVGSNFTGSIPTKENIGMVVRKIGCHQSACRTACNNQLRHLR